jgi:hypothetical protein
MGMTTSWSRCWCVVLLDVTKSSLLTMTRPQASLLGTLSLGGTATPRGAHTALQLQNRHVVLVTSRARPFCRLAGLV